MDVSRSKKDWSSPDWISAPRIVGADWRGNSPEARVPVKLGTSASEGIAFGFPFPGRPICIHASPVSQPPSLSNPSKDPRGKSLHGARRTTASGERDGGPCKSEVRWYLYVDSQPVAVSRIPLEFSVLDAMGTGKADTITVLFIPSGALHWPVQVPQTMGDKWHRELRNAVLIEALGESRMSPGWNPTSTRCQLSKLTKVFLACPAN